MSTLPFPGEDPRITRHLAERHAAPADPAYWARLEDLAIARALGIPVARAAGLARAAAAAPLEWWGVFPAWTRVGLAAAAAALMLAGAAFRQTHELAAREALAVADGGTRAVAAVASEPALPAGLAGAVRDLTP